MSLKDYRVWAPEVEDESDGGWVDARDPVEAAEEYAEDVNYNLEYIFSDSSAVVCVKAPDGKVTKVKVRGEPTIDFVGEVVEG